MSRRHRTQRQRRQAEPSRLLQGLMAQHAGWQMVGLGRDDAPLSEAGRDRHLDMMRSGLAELRCGSRPGDDAWRLMADLCNYIETVGALGYADRQEIAVALQPAVHGLARAAQRHQEDGRPLRLDGPALQALQWALEAWAQVLSEVSEQVARHITLVTQRRAWLIQTGQIRPRDTPIVELNSTATEPAR